MRKAFSKLKNVEELKLELYNTNLEKLERLKLIQTILQMKKLRTLTFKIF